MERMIDLVRRLGEPMRKQFLDDFDIDPEATMVVDFFNHDGLVTHVCGEYCAVVYIALVENALEYGCWTWKDGEDFDDDAEWHIFESDAFNKAEKEQMINEIHRIYGL